jgi:hypothetical protein
MRESITKRRYPMLQRTLEIDEKRRHDVEKQQAAEFKKKKSNLQGKLEAYINEYW